MGEDLDAVTLRVAQKQLWRCRWFITLVAWLGAITALVAAWLTPRQFEAIALLSPVSTQSGSGSLGALGSVMSQLGGLASLAGLPLPTTGGSKAETIATLQSESLTERFIQENNLLPVLYQKEWDPQRARWKAADASKVPTLWKANRRFASSIRSVRENSKNGLVTLTITWTDPAVAAKWANGLVKLTNDYLRENAIAESERDIAYLNNQVDKTSVVEVRNAIYALMVSEFRKEMLARGSEEYALRVIDPAVAPELASSPKRLAWVAAGLIIGTLLSVVLVLARERFRSGAPLKP
jgi:uncharacterized protein involved in exopolysaccharide biosynthesis